MNNLRDKLLGIERTINIYDKNNKLLREIVIDIALEKLKRIISPNNNDPELFDGYKLNLTQLQQLSGFIKTPIRINLEKYSYHLVTTGLYDWK